MSAQHLRRAIFGWAFQFVAAFLVIGLLASFGAALSLGGTPIVTVAFFLLSLFAYTFAAHVVAVEYEALR